MQTQHIIKDFESEGLFFLLFASKLSFNYYDKSVEIR